MAWILEGVIVTVITKGFVELRQDKFVAPKPIILRFNYNISFRHERNIGKNIFPGEGVTSSEQILRYSSQMILDLSTSST